MDEERMRELAQEGYYCSQILMIMGLELQGKTNPDLIASMQGLAGGLGFSGELCGALSGGASLLGLYAGKQNPQDEENPLLRFMIEDLVKWFKQEYGEEFGGIRCEELLAGNSMNQMTRCPLMVSGVFNKVKELLVENGFDLSGTFDE
ncbi:MAG: C-GCAxxG-C-C family protein [Anaerolineaceae bacterium]|jgi:C_GCAxxG_C_C family probable redox protein|nr:C-GCAxxG-C-C family protein [Anaerolineaceae bacterium]